MKIFVILLIIASLGISGLLTVRFLFGGNEDRWVCKNGEWIRHGNPSIPKPKEQCGSKLVNKAKDNLEDTSLCLSYNGNQMTYATAKEIAAAGCKEGKLKEEHSCNPNSGTWWIEFEPTNLKEGCNPACVVYVDTGTTEINWRCTGLIPPN